MARRARNKGSKQDNGATLGFEEKLWQMADALRSNMDPSEYKHMVLGLIFLKHISDAFEALAYEVARLLAEFASGKTLAQYRADAMLRSAVERQFQIIGEALTQALRVSR